MVDMIKYYHIDLKKIKRGGAIPSQNKHNHFLGVSRMDYAGLGIHLRMRNHMLLTQSEVEIMEILWETGAEGKKITILELIDAINSKYDRELKRQTVKFLIMCQLLQGKNMLLFCIKNCWIPGITGTWYLV